jgi:hypothetical protein
VAILKIVTRFVALALAGAVVLGTTGAARAADGESDRAAEYRVKAAVLLNFARFAEWPASRFAAPDAPLVIGIVGGDPFEGVLDEVVLEQHVGTHPVRLLRLAALPPIGVVHELFFAPGASIPAAEALAALAATGTLTVGEDDEFLAAGGALALVVEDRHVRFHVNLDVMGNSPSRLPSDVLRLATVRRGGRDKVTK